MSKSQQRELKEILAVIARVLRSKSLDDAVLCLLYRAQTLADGAFTSTVDAQIHKAG
jgi:hypothetical protein